MPALLELLRELEGYPVPTPGEDAGARVRHGDAAGIVVPLRLRVGDETLSFMSTTTLFGTPLDVTLAELAIESFFPMDAATAASLARLTAAR